MGRRTYRFPLPSVSCIALFLSGLVVVAQAQVFVVGEKSATADVSTQFTPTSFPLPSGHLSERGRLDLVRNLESEQGFAHRALPMGAGLSVEANGQRSPGAEQYRMMLYSKGRPPGVGGR